MAEEERTSATSESDSSSLPIRFATRVIARTTGTAAGLVPLAAAVYHASQGDMGGVALDLSLGGGIEGVTWGDKVVPRVAGAVRRLAGRGRQRQP